MISRIEALALQKHKVQLQKYYQNMNSCTKRFIEVKKIGITGSIGSGKTYVSKVFESLGIPVFNADNEAKKIMSCSFDLINSLKNEFGHDIYDNYYLNKKKLASIVFQIQKLKKLNSLVHPFVKQEFLNWCKIQKSPT